MGRRRQISFLVAYIGATLFSNAEAAELHRSLDRYATARVGEFDKIPLQRREALMEIAEYVRSQRAGTRPVRLTFICTANSRRSQLGQVWAAVAATRYGVEGVETFSGGTENAAFNPRAIAALERAGVTIKIAPIASGNPENHRYAVRFTADREPLICFSKVYNERPNPSAEFCAVLVCSDADEKCPNVRGAKRRVSLPYDDPKAADDTPEESKAYDERCAQIAREMLFVFSRVSAGK